MAILVLKVVIFWHIFYENIVTSFLYSWILGEIKLTFFVYYHTCCSYTVSEKKKNSCSVLNDDIGMEADVDIGTLPILECEDLVRHILFQYRNKRCRCRMPDITGMKADVDAHLCK
jgi:hypothetical protein